MGWPSRLQFLAPFHISCNPDNNKVGNRSYMPSGTNGYPIHDPNPKYFSIPDPYPIDFQNHRVFRASGLRENQGFDMNPGSHCRDVFLDIHWQRDDIENHDIKEHIIQYTPCCLGSVLGNTLQGTVRISGTHPRDVCKTLITLQQRYKSAKYRHLQAGNFNTLVVPIRHALEFSGLRLQEP